MDAETSPTKESNTQAVQILNRINDMGSINEIIDEAIQTAGLLSGEMSELPENEAKEVYQRAKSEFVDGNPRVWWLRLKKKPRTVDTDNSEDFHYLRENWPHTDDSCYFIPENEKNHPIIFNATLEGVIKVLGNSSFFEYYLVGKQFDWLLIENDHNELLIVKHGSTQEV